MIIYNTSQAFYRQCELENGSAHEVVWIPEKFAKAGKVLDFANTKSWTVKRVYDTRRPEEEVLAAENDYRHAFPSLEHND